MWHPSFKDDPLAWCMYAFPWGQKNTPLERFPNGPREWQKEEFRKIAAHIRENKDRVARGEAPQVYHLAISSGRGPGKSAFVAMLTWWFMSCIAGGTEVVTANTDAQLTDKTFGEIGKWQALCLSGYWFERIQKKIKPNDWYAELLEQHLKIERSKYYAAGILWDEENPDAFAGEHSQIGMLLVMDEASGIPEKIWDVSEGFFTDQTIYRFWIVLSNPRRNTGSFFECFHKYREFWSNRKIDARTVDGLDKSVYERIIAKHGVHSDQARIEVYGEFPETGERQFISRVTVDEARARKIEHYDPAEALVMGVDPARFGGDATVIRFRQGRDARSISPIELHKLDNMRVAEIVADQIDKHNPGGVFIDSGAGAGIIDRLKQMGYQVFEVGFGTASTGQEFYDHRTELWARMREWLQGAMIDDHDKLRDDFCGPEYGFAGREDRLKLESKEDMKERGLASPDHADALALTFHAKIARISLQASRRGRRGRIAQGVNYKIFGGP